MSRFVYMITGLVCLSLAVVSILKGALLEGIIAILMYLNVRLIDIESQISELKDK